jgi:hypothetical protein
MRQLIAHRVALVGAIALLASNVQAAGRTREQREAEARKACAAGRVESGIEVLAGLYTDFGHPNYIYNQARCYQQNGRTEQAISRFKEFLRAAPDASPEDRARVERFVHELEGERQPATPAVAPPPPAPPPSTPESTARPVTPPMSEREVAPAASVEVARPAPAAHQPSGTLRTAGLTLGVVSAASIVAGVIASLEVRSLNNAVEGAHLKQFSTTTLPDQEKKAHRLETLQWVGYGVGAAAAVGAILCLAADASERGTEHAARLHVVATASPGQAELGLAGRF